MMLALRVETCPCLRCRQARLIQTSAIVRMLELSVFLRRGFRIGECENLLTDAYSAHIAATTLRPPAVLS